MPRHRSIVPIIGAVIVLGLLTALCLNTMATPNRLSWVTGYWFSPPVYGRLPVAAIDYAALTHIIHYSLVPAGDGTFDSKSLGTLTAYSPDLVQTAHRNGVKALLGVAQSSSGGDFIGATAPANLDRFISNIMSIVDTYDYDGVDLDWENKIDTQQFVNLVTGLRARLDARPERGLLSGAFWSVCCSLDTIQGAFDQINVMTYDNCTPADGFSWHNSAIYDGGDPRKRTVDWRINQFVLRIPPAKLGLGIPFYGYAWRGGAGTSTGGVTAPGQTWTSAPKMSGIDYHTLLTDPTLWKDGYKRRDQVAGVPYLSIDLPGADQDAFVTYEDEASVARKVLYASARGLGGIMVYELSADYFPGQEPAHPLLEAVKNAAGARLQPGGKGLPFRRKPQPNSK